MTVEEVTAVVQAVAEQAAREVGEVKPFRVTRITAAPAERLHEVEPLAAAGGSARGGGVVWALEVEGTFLGLRRRDGPPIVIDKAFFVVADGDGSIIEWGSR